MHLTSMPNLTPTGIRHYLTGGRRGVTGSREGIWSKLGSEEGCFSEMRAQWLQCNSDRGTVRKCCNARRELRPAWPQPPASKVALGSSNAYLMQGSPAQAHEEDTCHWHLLQPHPFCKEQKLLPRTPRAHRYHVIQLHGTALSDGSHTAGVCPPSASPHTPVPLPSAKAGTAALPQPCCIHLPQNSTAKRCALSFMHRTDRDPNAVHFQ